MQSSGLGIKLHRHRRVPKIAPEKESCCEKASREALSVYCTVRCTRCRGSRDAVGGVSAVQHKDPADVGV